MVPALSSPPRSAFRGRVTRVYLGLVTANLAVWALSLLAFRHWPQLVATAVLAYALGLRHAVDADHIAAIDNVTRKLMQDGQRPVGVGLFFSLGHSTVVVVAAGVIAVGAAAANRAFPGLKEVGGLIGTSVSAGFLLLIAAINAVILRDVWIAFKRVRAGGALDDGALDRTLDQRGLLGRFFRPLYRLIDRSWKMYPLGLLFGLGFDTASEVGLLGISAVAAVQGMPLWSILLFAALFTAGMSLVDTTDGVLMVGAYGWAYTRPVRKLYYNLSITLISVVVAVLIGGVEAGAAIASHLGLTGPIWGRLAQVNEALGSLGYLVIGVFVAGWLISVAVYKLGGFERLEPAGPGDD